MQEVGNTHHEVLWIRVAYEAITSCLSCNLVSDNLCFDEALPAFLRTERLDEILVVYIVTEITNEESKVLGIPFQQCLIFPYFSSTFAQDSSASLAFDTLRLGVLLLRVLRVV